MGKPIIGITTYNDVTIQGYPVVMLLKAYVSAIIRGNGVPVLIPSGFHEDALKELYPRLDGILFTGGGDISIVYHGGQDHPSISNVDEERDLLELTLMKAAIRDDKPFLGICRGFQLLNVILGGSLYTHIAAQKSEPVKHDYYPDYPRDYLAHKVEISADSKLAGILDYSDVQVNSLHHQGVKNISDSLKAVGFAPDRLIEAVELPEHRFGIAVQWHPEWLVEDVSMRQLFSAFTEAARSKNWP